MNASERLTILRGIEKKVKFITDQMPKKPKCLADVEQLVNFLILDDLKTVQAQEVEKITKTGEN